MKLAHVFFDGRFVGYTDKPEELVKKIRELRRKGEISYQVNVAYHKHLNEVRIFTDSGRVRRPLIIVENGKSKLTKEWIEKLKKGKVTLKDLIKNGIIEFLDAEEEENAFIALKEDEVTENHTHLEIHPSTILGLSASLIPYAEFNRGDRVNYGAKMAGQAIGMFSLNYLRRTDTKSNILLYPQKPLVQTFGHKLIKYERKPAGINVTVAFMPFMGYNIEDALVFNKASIERGLFWSYMFRTYTAEEKRYMGGQEDVIGIPQPGIRGYAGEDAYKHLPEDGIVNPETEVKSDQVLVGRISPLRFLGSIDRFITGLENLRETSIRLRHGDKGIVDRVIITETADGTKLVKVIVRDLKIPEIGDKFATRHGQKGVIGLVASQEDLPFTEDGTIPDIVFDPHGIPSRMTMGNLLEIIAGKVAALSGKILFSPPFSPIEEREIRRKLKELHYRDDGKETMYEGMTGRLLPCRVFIGSCFYEKLDHLVSNKIHARARGPVTLLTKQPTEGRSKEGGLRLGEMEKDCLLAHGAVITLKERFDSDKALFPVCTECGLIAVKDHIRKRVYCPVCGESKISWIEMSYAFKLMLDELKCMCIYPKLIVKDNTVEKIEFSILSPEMIKKMAAAKITKPDLYDEEGYPIEGGVVDPRLGVVDPGLRCRTCGGNMNECNGHFGYIELTRPVVHVLYVKFILFLLKIFCRKCGRILIEPEDIKKLQERKITLKELVKKVKKECPYCKAKQKKIKLIKPYTFVEENRFLNPIEIRERLEKISDEDLRLLKLGKFRPEWLILTLLPVPPVTVRPSITLETGERSEDDLTHKLVDIVRINERLRENIELGAPDFIIEDLWELLQYHVATLFDNELTGVPPARHRSGRPLKTLTQRLKTKEGRFRGNLAGKRVNFSARTVISPDPMIELDEVGVPVEVAKELTIPVRVTKENIEELRKLILNGPNKWPGANYIIRPDGRKKRITDLNKEEIAKEIDVGYIVERHLQNGDIVLFNRQPSLHRMSMMAHRARIMPFKTFRLHLCVCPPYNADFDGDEMNLHVPQTDEARAEAEMLMIVHKHIRSPRFSGPIIGLIRDYIAALYLLTKDETKLDRKNFVRLIRFVDKEIEIPKKKVMSGKEIFSLFLPKDFSIEYRNKSGELVVIKSGKLIKGVIDKAGVGAESGKILDKLEKEYGPKVVCDFMSKISRLSIYFLTLYGFSISISDQDLPIEARKAIDSIIKKTEREVNKLIEEFERGELKVLAGRSPKESLEHAIKIVLRNCLNEAQKILVKFMKENPTLIMAKSGARGDIVNILQTAALVGQEMIMGERIERGYYHRTFPHFKIDDMSLESKGFVRHGFKDGLTPFEFFFDAMNSRESLMDKSLKTRHSGYMERRLVGALEDLKVEYDGTVRDASKRIIQFLAGEDGLDPSKIRRGGINVREIAARLFG